MAPPCQQRTATTGTRRCGRSSRSFTLSPVELALTGCMTASVSQSAMRGVTWDNLVWAELVNLGVLALQSSNHSN